MVTNQNSAFITGIIASPYYLVNCTMEDGPCYKVFVDIQRISGITDTIPVIVPETCLEDIDDRTGCPVSVKGTFQSMNRYADGRKHLDLFVYADTFTFTERGDDKEEGQDSGPNGPSGDWNIIHLEGYITKEPVLRTTSQGKKITDVMIAVNSPDPKHPNYIPCVAWGRNAYLADRMQVGDCIRLKGRVQSREYKKILHGEDGDTVQQRVAYEISCFFLEPVEEEPKSKKKEEEESA